jgi:hypothetical protein
MRGTWYGGGMVLVYLSSLPLSAQGKQLDLLSYHKVHTESAAVMARFAVANSQDQSAAIWIVAILLLAYTTLTTLVRGFVKFSMPGLDDGVAGFAQLFTYGNVFSVIYALLHGLAKTRPSDAVAEDDIGYEKVCET